MKSVRNEKRETALHGQLWKWLIGLALLCLAVYLVILYMPHREEVSWSGTAVEYRVDDMDYVEDYEAIIEGTYTYHRAGKRTFEGDFWIDGLDMDPGTRAKLTPEGDQFYDANGQPVTTRICGVIQSPDGQGAVALLWDRYTAEDGRVHAELEQGRSFICVGTLSREDAAALAETLKQQITGA